MSDSGSGERLAAAEQLVVWKHDIPHEINDLDLVAGARVLHVAEQAGRLRLWEAHPISERQTTVRRFRIAGTGHPFPAGGVHVGSLLAAAGALVFHVFEETA